MQATIEKVSSLERRLNVSLPAEEISAEVGSRLKNLARSAKMSGFRPGKVPMKVIEQQYGGRVHQEVLGDALSKTFGEAVRQQNLRVAGYPRFQAKDPVDGQASFEFSATFEVYPEIEPAELGAATVEAPALSVTDAEVDQTIRVLREQRATFAVVDRPAQAGDRITMDYSGTIEGVAFEGGAASDQVIELGKGNLLKGFEDAIVGAPAGESRSFDLVFPEDYHGKDVAGKTARFDVTVKQVEEVHLPEVDAAFAQTLGVEDGDIARMREEIKANVEREVRRRIQARLKDQVMKTLLEAYRVELPKVLVQAEVERLMESMREDLAQRGMDAKKLDFKPEPFMPDAERRVALGLIIADLVQREKLQAEPHQVRAIVEDYSQSYEDPQEVVRWHYQSPERLRQVESLALEDNVVKWVLERARVTEVPVGFDELMGNRK